MPIEQHEKETPGKTRSELPVPDETPASEEAPVTDETPVPDETPAPEEAPVTDDTPAPEEPPVTDDTPAPEELPVPDETPAPEELPVTDETPASKEISVTEEAPEEPPVPDETRSEPPVPPASAEGAAWAEEWNRCFPGWENGERPSPVSDGDPAAPGEGGEVPGTGKPGEGGKNTSSPHRERPRRDARLTRRHRKRRRGTPRHRGAWIFLALLSVAVLLAVGIRWRNRYAVRPDPFIWNYRESEGRSHSKEITIPAWPTGQGASFLVTEEHGDSLTAQEVYKTVNPSVVTVVVNLDNVSAAVGTGVIFSPDGYALTNYHVIEGGQDCMVITDNGYRLGAKYVAGDETSDLAVLKLVNDGGDPLPTAEFGDSNRLIVGDPVYAIGNPLGVELRGTMTNGIVSAASRDIEVEGRIMTLIQTNAALNSGNSGGPLINEYGQVVGINVVKMSSNHSTVEGLGFAIPSATMERLVNDLLSFGESQPLPSMGIMVMQELEEAAEGVRGLKVDAVNPDSPAERAGLLAGDFLLSADGKPLESSADLLRLRNRHYPGEEMTVLLWRDGEQLEVTLVLGAAVVVEPEETGGPLETMEPEKPELPEEPEEKPEEEQEEEPEASAED